MEPEHQNYSPVPPLQSPLQMVSQEALFQAPQGTSPPSSAQLLSGVSDALIHAMTTHFDKGLAANQKALLERISIQDSAIVKQQQFLESISRDILALRDESTQTQETFNIEVHGLHAKTEQLRHGVDASTKLLAARTLKRIRECQAMTEQRLVCVEESLEGLKEEIKDLQANAQSHGSKSSGRSPAFPYGKVAPTRSNFLSDSTPRIATSVSALQQRRLGSKPCDTQRGPDDDRLNPVFPMSSTQHVDQSSFEKATAGASESSYRQPVHETANPLDSLHIPDPGVSSASSTGSSSGHEVGWQADIEAQRHYTSGIQVHTSSPAQSKATGNPAKFVKLPSHVTSSSLSSLDSVSSSGQVLDNLCADQMENPMSSCLSRSSNTSAPGSAISSTVSLPEPTALLDELFSKPRNKVPGASVPPIQVLARSEQPRSMSSELSSIPSEDVPLVVAGTLSGPATDSLGRNSESTRLLKGTSTPKSANKRRHSSPSPVPVKTAKRARRQAATGKIKKKAEQELLDGTMMRMGGRKKPSPSPSRCSWPEMRAAHEAGSRQFIQCDVCQLWYHWGCVGIQINDLRLEDDEFACPPCQGKGNHGVVDGQGGTCSRPDCNIGDDAREEYFIERIIGRMDHKKGGIARFSWLIKWEGYPAHQSTWTPHAELGNATKLIEDFETTAKQEGLQLKCTPLVLLQQAADAGWAVKKDRKLVST